MRTAASSPWASHTRRPRASRSVAAAGLVGILLLVSASGPAAEQRRYTVAFANFTEEPGITLEGTGFTGQDVRESFRLAARGYPLDLIFYDNRRDGLKALANVEDAIARRVNLYIQYFRDAAVNATVAEKLTAANIPVLAVNYPVPGAPLYTVDNVGAGGIAGEALAQFARTTWSTRPTVGVLLGDLTAVADRVPERAKGVQEGLKASLPGLAITSLDTGGNPAQVASLLGKFLSRNSATKILIAAMDDATALAAKDTLERVGRRADGAIVSHGADSSIHGGMSERKELDPTNRGSIVIGSVAFYLDRYGYDILPLALSILRGESVPPRTVTRHRLITPSNVFVEYPPHDMQ